MSFTSVFVHHSFNVISLFGRKKNTLIQTNKDSSDVLRHIIKNVSKRLTSSTKRTAESDTEEGTEERPIRTLPIVTTLSFVRAVKDKGRGVRVSLTCYNYREYVRCEKPQEEPIHLSKERTMRLV